jgi:Caspase domain
VLVGVNHYEDRHSFGELEVCAHDATKVREQLIAGGFDSGHIHLLTDKESLLPLYENILAALQIVANDTKPDDLLLFYFSGHGQVDTKSGESYLIPRNGRSAVLSDTAVAISRVKKIMLDAGAQKKVIVLDACHSGADIGTKGAQPMSAGFIDQVFKQAQGLAIMSSCTEGQLSYEWPEEQCSVFTYYFLEALRGHADRDNKGFVTVHDVSRYVVNGVKGWARQHLLNQTPTLHYVVVGDITIADCATPNRRADPPTNREAVTQISKPVLISAREYFIALQKAAENAFQLFTAPSIPWSFQCDQINEAFHLISRPTIPSISSLRDPEFNSFTTRYHHINEQVERLVSHIHDFGHVHQGRAQQIKSQQNIVRDTSSLLREIKEMLTMIDALENSLDSPEREDKDKRLESDLEPYIGEVQAMREGRVHQEFAAQLAALGVRVGELPATEDMLERYKRVPLHAVFLYTTEDLEVAPYITDHYRALDSLSKDICDIYPITAQFRNIEEAYQFIHQLDVIRQSNTSPTVTQLPGLFFWDHKGGTAYISFGKSVTHDEIKHILRTIFNGLQKNSTIDSIKQAEKVLEREQDMSHENEQKRPVSRNDILVISLSFLIIIAGLIVTALFVSPLLLSIVLIAALLFFVLFMVWYLRGRNELSEGNLVKIVERFFNALPLLREQRPKEEKNIQHHPRNGVEPH